MKDRPILFSAPMIRALLAGTKTQTRRACKLPASPDHLGQWEPFLFGGQGCRDSKGREISGRWTISHTRTGAVIGCPYGSAGERLWVRETIRAHEITEAEAAANTWRIGDRLGERSSAGLDGVVYVADNAFREIANTREASERWMKVNAYRGLRGAVVPGIHMPRWACRIVLEITDVRVERLQDISEADALAEGVAAHPDGPWHAYRSLWTLINGAGSWDANPWVWVVSFRRIEQ